jgi:Ca-activated chloride channel homolog
MLDPTTMTRAGLFVLGKGREPVPLAGVTVDAEIRSVYAKVVISHRYVNTERTPIEAVYLFPLDEGAAVCAFEAVVDGTLVVGEIHEREKAFEMYDEAMEAGDGAFLLDEERPDIFQASIGNLAPGKEVTVRLTYVTELAVDDGRLRFVIPTTISPRYAPVEDHQGTGRPDAQALNPPVAWEVPYGLSLSVRLAMPGGISGVESPSHPIAITMNGCDATVSLGQKEAAPIATSSSRSTPLDSTRRRRSSSVMTPARRSWAWRLRRCSTRRPPPQN